MLHKVMELTNEEGLRSKPAAYFVQVASKFNAQILIEKGNKKINAKSIMGVLSLGVTQGETIHIVATGEDEKEAIEALNEAVINGFKEV